MTDARQPEETATRTYRASCHCGLVHFSFRSEAITSGRRCNCSFCARRGNVVSAVYLPPEAFDAIHGTESLSTYRFGDQSMNHHFCSKCGISPFSVVTSIPDGYVGAAKPGYCRINLACVHDLDVFSLDITVLDGKSL